LSSHKRLAVFEQAEIMSAAIGKGSGDDLPALLVN